MSLDVYLESDGVEPVTVASNDDDNEVYWANITHNLSNMARQAGIYDALWRPDEIGIERAAQLIVPLSAGLGLLQGDRPRFEAFNPANGWGNYDGLVRFVKNYLAACIEYPEARVRASR